MCERERRGGGKWARRKIISGGEANKFIFSASFLLVAHFPLFLAFLSLPCPHRIALRCFLSGTSSSQSDFMLTLPRIKRVRSSLFPSGSDLLVLLFRARPPVPLSQLPSLVIHALQACLLV